MCELFAISSKQPNTATFTLDEFSSHGGVKGPHVDGWGLAFFQDYDIQLIREITPAANSPWLKFVRDHQTKS
jgi:predicted glutamine amidotransferase